MIRRRQNSRSWGVNSEFSSEVFGKQLPIDHDFCLWSKHAEFLAGLIGALVVAVGENGGGLSLAKVSVRWSGEDEAAGCQFDANRAGSIAGGAADIGRASAGGQRGGAAKDGDPFIEVSG